VPARKFINDSYGIAEFDDDPQNVNSVINDTTITDPVKLRAYLEGVR
jgi:hypothetical protein